jgi:hypothetical protein
MSADNVCGCHEKGRGEEGKRGRGEDEEMGR